MRPGILLLAVCGFGCAAVGSTGTAAPKPEPPSAALRFTPRELDLAPGESYPVELFVPSPTRRQFLGRLSFAPESGLSVAPDPRWTGKVPPWGVKTYPRVTAAPDLQGDRKVTASLEKGGTGSLLVKVARPQIEPVPGDRKLTVRVRNPFRLRLLHGRVKASNPDRFLQDVTTREFKLLPGASGELVFPLPGAAPAEGETYDFTLTVETYQGYREQKTYSLAFPPQEPK